MGNQSKEEIVQDLSEKMQKASGVIVVDFTGINVADVTALRRKCRAGNIDYRVVKNTLSKRALADLPYRDDLSNVLCQPTAMAFGYDDPFAPIKLLADFAKGNDKIKLKAAVVEGHFYDGEAAKELAKIPSHDELIAKVLYCFQGPVSGFAQVCGGILQKVVGVLAAVKEKREQEGN